MRYTMALLAIMTVLSPHGALAQYPPYPHRYPDWYPNWDIHPYCVQKNFGHRRDLESNTRHEHPAAEKTRGSMSVSATIHELEGQVDSSSTNGDLRGVTEQQMEGQVDFSSKNGGLRGAMLQEMGHIEQQDSLSTDRALFQVSVPGTEKKRFQLRMFWQEGFCWQEELRERRWCMACEGFMCNEDDNLWIDECDSSSEVQQFVWEPVAGGGKLKPFYNQNLCYEKVANYESGYRMKPCKNTPSQVLVGLNMDSKFELHPKGDMNSCLTQEHDPKWFEIIHPDPCKDARYDDTNFWVVDNAVTFTDIPPPPQPNRACRRESFMTSGDTISVGDTVRILAPYEAYLRLHSDGNLRVTRRDGSLIWQSGYRGRQMNYYYTELQSDGHLVTYTGTPQNPGVLVWKSASATAPGVYSLDLNCDGETLSILLNNRDYGTVNSVWTTEPYSLFMYRNP